MSDGVIIAVFGLMGVLLTTTGTIVIAMLRLHSGKLDQIHYLVNDRLDKALAKINELQAALAAKRIAELELELEAINAVESGPEAQWPTT